MTGAGRRLALAALGLASCAGPPWYMGAPRDPGASLRPPSAARTARRLLGEAEEARRACRTVDELRALLVLADREALPDGERPRLARLLRARATAWAARGRAIPRAHDLARLAALDPEAASSRAERALAERDAGDAWLAIGEEERALASFRTAAALGAPELEARQEAATRSGPTSDAPLEALAEAVRVLPARAAAAHLQAYVARGGADPEILAGGWAVARVTGRPALAARLEALGVPPPTPSAPPATTVAFPAAALCERGAQATTPRLVRATLAETLLPELAGDAGLLDHVDAARWARALVAEDPTSPEALEVAARIEARGGRVEAAKRTLRDFVYYSPDREAALARCAALWERAGRPQEACRAWDALARWRGDPEDPAWARVVACLRRAPGLGDARALRAHLLERVPAARRAALAARLDGAADGP